VAKDGGARHVKVHILVASAWLVFDVTDDGAGFDMSATSYGTGLHGTTDRLAALGGGLTVTSRPGERRTVTGTVPGGTTED
jgi:signal transduction histidine kinase